jgi:hypothetical protein
MRRDLPRLAIDDQDQSLLGASLEGYALFLG